MAAIAASIKPTDLRGILKYVPRFQGQIFVLALDGSIVARGPASAAPLDCREIYVGRLNGNPGQSRAEARGLVGHIDELALFPRALPAEAIRLLAAGNRLALPE